MHKITYFIYVTALVGVAPVMAKHHHKKSVSYQHPTDEGTYERFNERSEWNAPSDSNGDKLHEHKRNHMPKDKVGDQGSAKSRSEQGESNMIDK